jgi:signal transduction histidine kinase
MRLPSNLRLRFALWSSAIVFLAVAAHGITVYATMSVFLHGTILEKLRFSASQVAATLEIESGRLLPPDAVLKAGAQDTLGEAVATRVYDAAGSLVFQSGPPADFPGEIVEALSQPVYRQLPHDLAVFAAPFKNDGRVVGLIEVAESIEPVEQTLRQLLLILVELLPLFVLASAASGYFLAARLLKPIDIITKTVRRISEQDLSARVGQLGNDELGRLAEMFDAMLGRLEDSFVRYKQFTADASHELRTPVSVIRSILSVTKRRPRTAADYEEALVDLESATDRLESLISALIVLSRNDSDTTVPALEIDVGDLLLEMTDTLKPLALERRLFLNTALQPGCIVSGDRNALVHAFVNVLDNALKYTTQGGAEVALRASASEIVIEVRDTGMGIPPEHLQRIFDRFYRVDPSRSQPGTGLGLAIARSVIERHHGSIVAESVWGTGTTIRIRLPRTLP